MYCAQLAPGKGTANIRCVLQLAKFIPKNMEDLVFLQIGDKYMFLR
jgi:hypothetical protein